MKKHLLSKSTFQRGLQCEKSLYLYKNFIQYRDPLSPEQKSIFNRGNRVGVLAQQLFPGGLDISKVINTKEANRYQQMVEKTQALIASGADTIYEAAFQYDQVLVLLDILVKKDNEWRAYEVKSSTRISQTYIADISLQYWVISNSGLDLKDASLVIVNNQYQRNGPLDLKKLFSQRSVLKEVQDNFKMIGQHVTRLKKVALQAQLPEITIGEHCFSPYPCDFRGTCWKNVPVNSVFEIGGVPKAELFELYNTGYKTIEEVPDNNLLNEAANIHIRAFRTGEKIIKKQAIKTFVNNIQYPLSFLDFEVFMPAVPVFDHTHPYQHLPFQYSLHVKKAKKAAIKHFHFLAEQGIDPRKSFIESLMKDIPDEGTVMVYDTLMERKVLKALKEEFPEHAGSIDHLLSRLVDLMTPFKEKQYYVAEMNNSFSIKNVARALVKGFDYSELNIPNGSMAMTRFENLQTETDLLKILETRENLLQYCKMDTLAMVKIFEELENEVKDL